MPSFDFDTANQQAITDREQEMMQLHEERTREKLARHVNVNCPRCGNVFSVVPAELLTESTT